MVSGAAPISQPANGALWRFAVDFYARPGVAPACLELQDNKGRDIDLILFACWMGIAERGRLTGGDLAVAEALAAPWRQTVIAPLRAVRRRVKDDGDAADLYDALKTAELEAEHRALDRLEGLAPAPVPGATDSTADALANLTLYLGPDAASPAAEALRLALGRFHGAR